MTTHVVPGIEWEPPRNRPGYAMLGSTNGEGDDAGDLASRYGFRPEDLVGFYTCEGGTSPHVVLLLRGGHALRITFDTWEAMGDCGQSFSDYIETLDMVLGTSGSPT